MTSDSGEMGQDNVTYRITLYRRSTYTGLTAEEAENALDLLNDFSRCFPQLVRGVPLEAAVTDIDEISKMLDERNLINDNDLGVTVEDFQFLVKCCRNRDLGARIIGSSKYHQGESHLKSDFEQ